MIAHIKLTLLTFILFCNHLLSYSQNLEGTVTNKDGQPIPYATIFIKELSLGTTTNEDGEFNLDLPNGNYTAYFRSLGYVPQYRTLTIPNQEKVLPIVLEEQIIQINQIDIKGNGEDPAYPIMRKVIGLSYVHLNQVLSYAADVYVRGTVKFENIPGIIRNQLRKKQIDVKSGDVLVNETSSLINFNAPDKYVQHIRSVNSTFPKVVDFSLDKFLGASLYQDNIDILFTPLGKNAFTYYNFTYEGFDQDGQYTVNKIKVTPKRKSKQLVEGYIYIIENLWCLQRADLKFNTPFGAVSLRLMYDEVRPGVWLPVGHDYSFNGGMMGVRGNARFGASIKYNQLKVNDRVLAMIGIQPGSTKKEGTNPPLGITPKTMDSEKSKTAKIATILEKDKLSNREMTKLSRLMAQHDNALKPDSLKSLQIKDEVKVFVDKGAHTRDTAYWDKMRPIPLSLEEKKSFKERDSLLSVQKKSIITDNDSMVVHKRNYGVLNPLFFGMGRKLKDETWRVSYDGLISNQHITFDAVDGWKVKQNITFRKSYKPGVSLAFTPMIAYAFNRKAFLSTGTINYSYAPLHRGWFEISGGRNTFDFNAPTYAVHPFINSVASLFFKQNYGRYYENRFINLSNHIDIANGLVIKTNFKWSHIKELENTTNFSFINKEDAYSNNQPRTKGITPQSIEDQINSVANIRIEYTPRYFYRIKDGVKKMADSDYPTFFIEYKKGISHFLSSVADFDYLGAGILYGKELSSTSSVAADIMGGWFPNNSSIHFSDFAHAQTQSSPVLLKEYRHTFYQPSYYALTTQDKFLEAHLSIKAPYLILKNLPILSNTLWREMIWCSYYTNPVKRNYVEVGYTLLEVLLSANVGIYAGFDDGQFNTIGFNFSSRISL